MITRRLRTIIQGRSGRTLALILCAVGTLAGCESFLGQGGQGGSISKDVVETKLLVQRMADEQGQNKRTMDYRLESLEEKIQSRNEFLNSSLSDIEKRMRQQNDELTALKKDVSALAFQIDALIKQLDMKPATPSKETSKMLKPDQAGSDIFNEAYKQFTLGRYPEAKQGFDDAIAKGLTGDMAVQAQFYLGESFYRQNDLKSAYDNYTKLITSNPSHALAWQSLERLAEISQKQGRNADALRLYEKILTTYPNYEGIDRVKEQIQALRSQAGSQPGGAAAPGQAPSPTPAPGPAGTKPPK